MGVNDNIFLLENDASNIEPEHQVNLFFSVDLVNATKFKTENPKKWLSIFTSFYEFVIAAVKKIYDQEIMVWKLGGDEILFYHNITKLDALLRSPPTLYQAMSKAQRDLFDRHPQAKEKELYFQGAL